MKRLILKCVRAFQERADLVDRIQEAIIYAGAAYMIIRFMIKVAM